MMVWDGLQHAQGLRDVTAEAGVVSMHWPGVGQVIEAGPRFPSETKQYKSHMAHVEGSGALAS